MGAVEKMGGEGRMVQFKGDVWNEWKALLPDGENPISYFLKKDIPLYFAVDQVRHLVYRRCKIEFPQMSEVQKKRLEEISWASVSAEESSAIELNGNDLSDGIAYLRLDTASIEQLGHSQVCKSPKFMGWALAPMREYRVTGHDRRGRPIREEEQIRDVRGLVRVDFESAVIIDKEKWEQARGHGEAGLLANARKFRAKVTVRISELFLDTSDIERLREERQVRFESAKYPFRHGGRMPGIHGMYQAAYLLNYLKQMKGGGKGVKRWLMEIANHPHCDRHPYRYRSRRTAEKFVKMKVDRNQGGSERGAFDLEKIESLRNTDKSNYKTDFISDGLAMILAIADHWVELVESGEDIRRVDLAKILMTHAFSGLEVGDLVYLMAGKRLNQKDVSELKTWVENEQSEVEWRNVLDRESRVRSRHKKKEPK